MREVINLGLERELRIIQYLYEAMGPRSIKEISNTVKVTRKTIRTDINRINENFPFLQIEISSRGQVRLNYPDYIGIEYVYRAAMDLSLEIKIFEYLLSNPDYSISVYTEEFFISESMFRRIIHKWNRAFAGRGIPVSISTFPVVTIQGDEITIRQLFHRYLMEKYEGNTKSEFLREMSSIWELVARIWGIRGIKISYTTHQKLAYWFFISIKRIKKKYYIKKDYTEHGKGIARLIYAEISKDAVFREQFALDNRMSLSVETLLDMMEIYDFNILLMTGLPKENTVYESKEISLSLKAVKDFLLSLYESFNYQDSSFEQTSIKLYHSLACQNKVPFFFYGSYNKFKEYVKRENSLFMKIFEAHLQNSNLPDYLKQKDELKNELLHYVITHSKSFLERICHLTIPKKLLILTTYSCKYMYWLRKKIENRFAEKVAVSLYQSNQLKLDIDYLKQFDFILTNYENLPSELEDRAIYLELGVPAIFWEKLANKL